MLLGRHCRTEWPNNFRKMVVCVDGASAAPAVEPDAVEWAKTLGLDVHSRDRDPSARYSRTRRGARRDRRTDGGPRTARAQVRAARSRYPAGAIADFAESIDADLVAMSSHARANAAARGADVRASSGWHAAQCWSTRPLEMSGRRTLHTAFRRAHARAAAFVRCVAARRHERREIWLRARSLRGANGGPAAG